MGEWNREQGKGTGNVFGERFWGMFLGNVFGERFWGTLLGNTFGERFWGTILGNASGECFRGMLSGNVFGERFSQLLQGEMRSVYVMFYNSLTKRGLQAKRLNIFTYCKKQNGEEMNCLHNGERKKFFLQLVHSIASFLGGSQCQLFKISTDFNTTPAYGILSFTTFSTPDGLLLANIT